MIVEGWAETRDWGEFGVGFSDFPTILFLYHKSINVKTEFRRWYHNTAYIIIARTVTIVFSSISFSLLVFNRHRKLHKYRIVIFNSNIPNTMN